jgi:hypothetical protein
VVPDRRAATFRWQSNLLHHGARKGVNDPLAVPLFPDFSHGLSKLSDLARGFDICEVGYQGRIRPYRHDPKLGQFVTCNGLLSHLLRRRLSGARQTIGRNGLKVVRDDRVIGRRIPVRLGVPLGEESRVDRFRHFRNRIAPRRLHLSSFRSHFLRRHDTAEHQDRHSQSRGVRGALLGPARLE